MQIDRDEWLDYFRVPVRLAVWLGALVVLMFLGFAAHAQTVTLTAAPSSGVAPVDVSLSWSSSGFPAGATVSCMASGGWSGTKAASGTETVAGVTASATYTLTCSGGTQGARVTWTAPATNTDGSPITDLSHFNLYHAATLAGVSTSGTATRIDAPATTYTLTGLPTGPRCVGLTAVNSAGVASVLSNISCKENVGAVTASASASVTVTPRPNPPVIVTVEIVAGMNWTPVYTIANNGKQGALAGFVPAGVECSGSPLFTFRDAVFYAVPVASVEWWGPPKARVAAPCGTA